MKRAVLFAIVALLCVSAVLLLNDPADADTAVKDDSGTCGDNVTYKFEASTGILTISGSGAMSDFAWESTEAWHSYRDSVKTVVIESSVESVSYSAFYGCTSLTSVTIPDSVTSIGTYAFMNCTSLTSLKIPKSVTLISWAFIGCDSLNSIEVEAGNIDYCVKDNVLFSYDLKTLVLCPAGRSGAYTVPDTITSIEEYAFYNCTSLTSVIIGDSVTSIGGSAFRNCTSLTSVTIPNSVTSIEGDAFSGCTSLASVTIPNSITALGRGAFRDCTSLTSVVIPDSVTSIGDFAFYDCTSLALVVIGESVTTIGSSAFTGCKRLFEIIDLSQQTDVNKENSGFSKVVNYFTSESDRTVTTDDGFVYGKSGNICYLVGYTGKETQIEIPDKNEGSGYVIRDYAFYGCTTLTSVIISNSVTSIGYQAFTGCSSLTSVTIPESIKSIGTRAFSDCTALNEINFNAVSCDDLDSEPDVFDNAGTSGKGISVIFGNSVTKIPANLFCVGVQFTLPKIVSVNIPVSVKSIGQFAFSNCTSLTSVTIGNSVTSIGESAFRDCTSLTSVTIPDSVTSIGDFAFYDCTSLTSVTIGNSVTTLGPSAFYGCTALNKINFNAASCDDLGSCSDVFYNAGTSGDGITVIFGESVVKIPAYLFYVSESAYLPKVVSVDTGGSVTSIGKYAFKDCAYMTSMTIGESVTSIGSSAFSGCTSLTSVTIPDSVTSLGSSAFYDCTALNKINFNAGSCGDFSTNSDVFYNAGTSGDGITVIFGNSVTKVPAHLFYVSDSAYSPKVVSVDTGDSVTSIGDDAFRGCTSLASVTIGKSVTTIGPSAFCNCTALESVAIPDSVTTIESSAFWDCTSLTSVTVPDSVTTIESSAFRGCISLASVTIGKSVTTIGPLAFCNCTALNKINFNAISCDDLSSSVFNNAGTSEGGITVTFGDSVTRIPAYLFASSKIVSLDTGDSITTIGGYAFYDCVSLASVTIGNSVTTIGDNAFWDCTFLTSVTIGESVTSIGNSAFWDCVALEKINFNAESCDISTYNILSNAGTSGNGIVLTYGDSVTKISAGLFNIGDPSCSPKIVSLKIGKAVATIEDGVFRSCTQLSSIEVDENNGTYSSENGVLFNKDKTSLIQCAMAKSGIYVIPDSVTSIGKDAFNGCKSLTSVTIGESVTTFGESAFYNCAALEEIIFNAISCDDLGITNVFYDAGASGDGITVTFGDSVTKIPAYLFFASEPHSPKIVSVTIGKSVTSIGDNAFYNLTVLNKIDFNAISCDDLSSSIFYNAGRSGDGITVTFGDSVTRIPADLFCSYDYSTSPKIVSMEIGKKVTSIGDQAFSGCTSLTSVTIPDSVKTIENSAFFGCGYLFSVTIGKSVEYIDPNAFADCYRIFEVINLSSLTADDLSFMLTAANNKFTSVPAKSTVTVNDDGYVYGVSEGEYYLIGYLGTATDIVLPETLDGSSYKIREHAFQDSGLTSVVISDLTESVGDSAFSSCSSLTSVTLGKSVESLGENVFWYCTALTLISVDANNQHYCSDGGVLFNGDKTELIGYPSCKAGESYTIPDSVTSIGPSAFFYCTSLASVTIGNSVTSVGFSAFSGCTALTTVTFGNSVTSVGPYAFDQCTSLKSLTLPNSVTSLEYQAFRGCTSLISVTLPDSITQISAGLFEECKALSSLEIPCAVTIIEYNAFYNCTALEYVAIPGSVQQIGSNAFNGLTFYDTNGTDEAGTLAGYIYKGSDRKLIRQNTLSITFDLGDGNKIVKLHLEGDSITEPAVPERAGYVFQYWVAEDGTEYVFPGTMSANNMTLTAVWNANSYTITFDTNGGTPAINPVTQDCGTAVTAPETPSKDGFNFKYWSLDGETAYEFTTMPAGNITLTAVWVDSHCGEDATYLYDPSTKTLTISGSGEMYDYSRGTAPWYGYRESIQYLVIGGSIESIGESAFEGCTSLTSVTIPEVVKSIGQYAFYDCTALKKIIFNAVSCADVSYRVFDIAGASGDGITVTFGNSVTRIPAHLFGSSKIVSVDTGDSVTSIGSYAFSECSYLTSVTIGESVTSFGDGAFSYCPALTEINFNAISCKDFITSPFCKAGTSGDGITVKFGDSVTRIPDYLFYDSDSSYSPKILSAIIGKNVASIGDSAFYNCISLTSVTIGESVTSIGKEAFFGCTSLTSVTIPSKVTSIGKEAFYGCTGLVEVNFNAVSCDDLDFLYIFYNAGTSGNGMTVTFGDSVTKIPAYLFFAGEPDSPKIVSVTIGKSVTSIGKDAFRECNSITAVNVDPENTAYSSDDGVLFNKEKTTLIKCPAGKTGNYSIPESTTIIKDCAFEGCTSLTSVTIPSKVTSIGVQVFYGCTALESVVIPDSVTSIGYEAFRYCTSLESVTIGKSVTSINSSFGGCTALTEINFNAVSCDDLSSGVFSSAGTSGDGITVKFGDSVIKIPAYMFDEGSSLYTPKVVSVKISESVTSIGGSAFYGCTFLESVSIPKAVGFIGSLAFYGCTSLGSISVDPDNAAYSSDDDVLFDKDKTTLIQCAACKDGSYTIPASVTAIYSNAFDDCTSLTSIDVDQDNTIYSSEDGVLFDKDKTTLIRYPAGKVGAYAIPQSVTSVKPCAFYGCIGLTSVTIPDKITVLEGAVFRGCTALESVTIPDSVTSIGDDAFQDCTSLTSVTIPDTVTSIGEFAFAGAGKLTAVNIPDTVTSIGQFAFCNCTSLVSVTLPDSVASIGQFAFSDCSSLTSVIIPDSVTSIDSWAFYKCTSLTSVTIPDSVTSIGYEAFSGCTALTSVTIPATIENIDGYAFLGISFYDTGGSELSITANDLKGAIFRGSDGKLTKQATLELVFEYADGSETIVLYVKGDESIDVPSNSFSGGCASWSEYKLDGTTERVTETVNHTLEDISAESPTCTKGGTKAHQECSLCGTKFLDGNEVSPEQVSIDPKGHTEQTLDAKEPSCMETGLTEGKRCSLCGEVIKAQEIIPVTGHSVKTVEGKAATCVDAGFTAESYCSVCGEVIKAREEIPATGHAYEDVKYVWSGHDACKVTGTCSKCNYTESDDAIIESNVTKEASCTETGTKVYTATFKEGFGTITTTETLDKVAHAVETIPAVEATADTPAYTAGKKCSVCDAILVSPIEITENKTVIIDTSASSGEEKTEAALSKDTLEVITDADAETEIKGKLGALKISQAAANTLIASGENVNFSISYADGSSVLTSEQKGKLGNAPLFKLSATADDKIVSRFNGTITVTLPYVLSEGKAAEDVTVYYLNDSGRFVQVDCSYADGYVTFTTDHFSYWTVTDSEIVYHEMSYKGAAEPTCTQEGNVEYWHCEICDKYFSDEEGTKEITTSISKARVAHTYGKTEYTWNGVTACTAVKRCTVCGEGYGEVSTIITSEIPKEPTCTEAGIRTYTVTFNGGFGTATTTETVPAKGHTGQILEAKTPTCTETGLTEGKKCSVCNEVLVKQTVVPMKAHNLKKTEAEAPTCTKEGNNEYWTCSVCQKVFKDDKAVTETTVAAEVVKASGHTPKSVSATSATCTEPGISSGTVCSVCGKVLSGQITEPALGHKEVVVAGKNATCTETGLTEGKKCSVCNEVLVKQEVIPMTEHTLDSVKTIDATCIETGTKAHDHCSVCRKDFLNGEEVAAGDLVIPAVGHSMTQTKYTAPTCTEDGTDAYYTCGTCRKVFSDENGKTETTVEKCRISALGHSKEPVSEISATCTGSGTKAHEHCSVCGIDFIDGKEVSAEDLTISALGHKEEVICESVEDPYRLTEGKKCSVCGTVLVPQVKIEIVSEKTADGTESRVESYTSEEKVGSDTVSTDLKKTEGSTKVSEVVTVITAKDTSVSDESVTMAVEQLKRTLEVSETESETKTVKIDISSASVEEKKTEVTLSSDSLSKIKDAGAEAEIKGEFATLKISQKAAETLVTKGESVNLSAAYADKSADLTAEQKEKVGNAPLFKLSASADDKTVSKFGGKITVTLPYVLSEGKTATVYYINDSGRFTEIDSCVYDAASQTVTFETEHFSYWTITDSKIVYEDGSSDGGNGMMIVLAIAVIAILAIAGAVIVKKRKA